MNGRRVISVSPPIDYSDMATPPSTPGLPPMPKLSDGAGMISLHEDEDQEGERSFTEYVPGSTSWADEVCLGTASSPFKDKRFTTTFDEEEEDDETGRNPNEDQRSDDSSSSHSAAYDHYTQEILTLFSKGYTPKIASTVMEELNRTRKDGYEAFVQGLKAIGELDDDLDQVTMAVTLGELIQKGEHTLFPAYLGGFEFATQKLRKQLYRKRESDKDEMIEHLCQALKTGVAQLKERTQAMEEASKTMTTKANELVTSSAKLEKRLLEGQTPVSTSGHGPKGLTVDPKATRTQSPIMLSSGPQLQCTPKKKEKAQGSVVVATAPNPYTSNPRLLTLDLDGFYRSKDRKIFVGISKGKLDCSNVPSINSQPQVDAVLVALLNRSDAALDVSIDSGWKKNIVTEAYKSAVVENKWERVKGATTMSFEAGYKKRFIIDVNGTEIGRYMTDAQRLEALQKMREEQVSAAEKLLRTDTA